MMKCKYYYEINRSIHNKLQKLPSILLSINLIVFLNSLQIKLIVEENDNTNNDSNQLQIMIVFFQRKCVIASSNHSFDHKYKND